MLLGGLLGVGTALTLAALIADHGGDGSAGLAAVGAVPAGILVGGVIGATIGTASPWAELFP